eukprot:scaffold24741_cov53-Attheya_sp.AAC.1
MEETWYDEIGRIFCKKHKRDHCHECCFDFRDQNQTVEEDAGHRKKRTPMEESADMWAACVSGMSGMEDMVPRPSPDIFEMNRKYLSAEEEKLRQFAAAGEDVETAKKHALEKQRAKDLEMQGFTQAMAKQNPGQQKFEFGGPETQKIYDQFIKAPDTKMGRADMYTCVYCGITSSEKLRMCSRCKTISYCSRECQKSHWKVHKKECVKRENEPKSLPLTWEQVEAHQGAPVTGKTLEVRVMLDESVMRQVVSCKDRVGTIRRIAAYTDSRSIPDLEVGSFLRWKNPRYRYFLDGSSGGRIEEEDLPNVTLSKS